MKLKRMIKGQLFRHVIEQEFKNKIQIVNVTTWEIEVQLLKKRTTCSWFYRNIRNHCLLYFCYLPDVRCLI